MFGMKLKTKKLLKRKDFINSVDSKKIWSKAMTIPEIKDFDAMDKAYREKGIICVQEKDVILEMIQEMKKAIN